MRVLIVEDDAIVAMHLAMLLTELGHETCGTAASAATAIAQAAKYEPDIVPMDIRLAQGSSGIEAARELHARQSLRCIFLSANLYEPAKTGSGLEATIPLADRSRSNRPLLMASFAA